MPIEDEKREQIKENLTSHATWSRGFFMLLFAIIGYFLFCYVILVLVLFQFGTILFTGKINARIFPIGKSLSTYLYQILLYLTYSSDERPFPFSSWPDSKEEEIVNLTEESELPPKT